MHASKRHLLDYFGISLSFICIIHCFLTPILMVFAVGLGYWTNLHALFLLFIVPVTLLAAWTGYRHHKNKKMIVFFTIGLIFLVFAEPVGALVATNYQFLTDATLTTIGGSLVILGHFANSRKMMKCPWGCRNEIFQK